MTLEYFPDALEGRAVILLHSGSRNEVAELQETLRSLAAPSSPLIAVHQLPFVHAPLPCALFVAMSTADEGVTCCESAKSFEWRQTPAGWRRVNELLSPFVQEPGGGFQYLTEHDGPEVIYSTSRAW